MGYASLENDNSIDFQVRYEIEPETINNWLLAKRLCKQIRIKEFKGLIFNSNITLEILDDDLIPTDSKVRNETVTITEDDIKIEFINQETDEVYQYYISWETIYELNRTNR
jgi:hypothetical protein